MGLIEGARRPDAVQAVFGLGPGVVSPDLPSPRAGVAREQLHALRQRLLGREEDAVVAHLGDGGERIEEVFVSRPWVPRLAAVGVELGRPAGAEGALPAEGPVHALLGGKEAEVAVGYVELVGPVALIEVPPAETHASRAPEVRHQVDPGADLVGVGERFTIPTGPELGGQAAREANPVRHVDAVLLARDHVVVARHPLRRRKARIGDRRRQIDGVGVVVVGVERPGEEPEAQEVRIADLPGSILPHGEEVHRPYVADGAHVAGTLVRNPSVAVDPSRRERRREDGRAAEKDLMVEPAEGVAVAGVDPRPLAFVLVVEDERVVGREEPEGQAVAIVETVAGPGEQIPVAGFEFRFRLVLFVRGVDQPQHDVEVTAPSGDEPVAPAIAEFSARRRPRRW